MSVFSLRYYPDAWAMTRNQLLALIATLASLQLLLLLSMPRKYVKRWSIVSEIGLAVLCRTLPPVVVLQ
jgi:hypothetical protein